MILIWNIDVCMIHFQNSIRRDDVKFDLSFKISQYHYHNWLGDSISFDSCYEAIKALKQIDIKGQQKDLCFNSMNWKSYANNWGFVWV